MQLKPKYHAAEKRQQLEQQLSELGPYMLLSLRRLRLEVEGDRSAIS